MTETLTAGKAFDLYKDFLDRDALVQGEWHRGGDDGRNLACALGVLGPDIDSPSDCPSSVMPRWLAQMVPWFFDNQEFADAKDWGIRFYAELKRLNGVIPFTVVHDWQANVVVPLGLEWRGKKGISPDVTLKVQALHRTAIEGGSASKDEWADALRPMFRESYANANAYAYANAYADADANANANANADADADADANAYANANAYADADAYANAYAYADADADANANANADADAKKKFYQAAVKRLADGMIECLARVVA